MLGWAYPKSIERYALFWLEDTRNHQKAWKVCSSGLKSIKKHRRYALLGWRARKSIVRYALFRMLINKKPRRYAHFCWRASKSLGRILFFAWKSQKSIEGMLVLCLLAEHRKIFAPPRPYALFLFRQRSCTVFCSGRPSNWSNTPALFCLAGALHGVKCAATSILHCVLHGSTFALEQHSRARRRSWS